MKRLLLVLALLSTTVFVAVSAGYGDSVSRLAANHPLEAELHPVVGSLNASQRSRWRYISSRATRGNSIGCLKSFRPPAHPTITGSSSPESSTANSVRDHRISKRSAWELRGRGITAPFHVQLTNSSVSSAGADVRRLSRVSRSQRGDPTSGGWQPSAAVARQSASARAEILRIREGSHASRPARPRATNTAMRLISMADDLIGGGDSIGIIRWFGQRTIPPTFATDSPDAAGIEGDARRGGDQSGEEQDDIRPRSQTRCRTWSCPTGRPDTLCARRLATKRHRSMS